MPRLVHLRSVAGVAVLTVLLSSDALGQESAVDTTRVHELGAIMKVAERGETIVARTTAATSVFRAETMIGLPARSVSDWLALTPGMTFVSFDGLGYDPQPMVRGFYGGGEAEYIQLQINGVPVSDGESGLVNWHLIPQRAIGSVEILRGGSSALFGDAALGSVVNLVTDDLRPGGVLSVSAGTAAPLESELVYRGRVVGRRSHLFGSYRRIDGFRRHADREMGSIGGSINLVAGRRSTLDLTTLHWISDASVPGPLFDDLAATGPDDVLPFFRFDRRKESIHLLGVSGAMESSLGRVSFRSTGKLRLADVVETVPLSAGFADTQQRDLTDLQVSANVQLNTSLGSLPGELTAGADVAGAWLATDYATLLAGTLSDYLMEQRPVAMAVSSGDAGRTSGAAYLLYVVEPIAPLRIMAGGRLDVLHDTFSLVNGAEEGSTHTALSPKIGVNYRFLSRRHAVGNVYASVSRSFKAPTLDQLYDQRAIPVPFPPFRISLSSVDLEPQTGTGFEVGLYQRVERQNPDVAAEITMAVYRMDMKDEVDFDLQQLRFRNFGKSRHQGVESSVSLYLGRTVTGRISYTYQGTTIEAGESKGNYVKAIPRDVVTAMLAVSLSPVTAGISLTSAGRIFLDDSNLIPLPGYTNTSVHVSYDFGRFSIAGDVFNVFDRKFSTTGFPDPAGSDAIFLYPAADRQARLTVEVSIR